MWSSCGYYVGKYSVAWVRLLCQKMQCNVVAAEGVEGQQLRRLSFGSQTGIRFSRNYRKWYQNVFLRYRGRLVAFKCSKLQTVACSKLVNTIDTTHKTWMAYMAWNVSGS